MKWSKSFIFTLKEAPNDAEIPSHILMVRAGYIRKVAPGIFTYGPLALKAIRKFENIVREELTKRDCVEILMPMVQPKELWDETNRWTEMGEGLQKLKNRNGHDFCLGATHEEVATDFIRQQVKSYRDLPVNIFQIQSKFRDEIRPRFGLMRGREFIMKDAYSFDITNEAAQKSYYLMKDAYTSIFKRLGIQFRIVKADTGNIGGNQSEEFHILADSGEDHLMVSDRGDFAANIEICPVSKKEISNEPSQRVERSEFSTPGLKTIESLSQNLKIPPEQLVKTMFFCVSEDPKDIKPVAVLLRGSDEVNDIKVKNLLKLANPPRLLNDHEVLNLTGAHPGSCGPIGLKIPIYCDYGLEGFSNFIVGANKDDFHIKNVNFERDFKVTQFADLRKAKEGDIAPDGGVFKSYRGIEVGHIFYLGTKYSKIMKAQFLNSSGQLDPIEMGCYGIGISRTVQAVIEQCHDKDGIIWPVSIAPFHVHICLLDPKDENALKVADDLQAELSRHGLDVFIDDRDERPGVKFKDADLLGMPLRLNIGARGLQNNEIEIITRRDKAMVKVQLEMAPQAILDTLKKASELPG